MKWEGKAIVSGLVTEPFRADQSFDPRTRLVVGGLTELHPHTATPT